MSITIQEAIKAMDEGKIVKCLYNNAYHRVNKSSLYECSLDKDFSMALCTSIFSRKDIESPWEIIEEEEKIEPCIYCKSKTRIAISYNIPNNDRYYVYCTKDFNCGYRSPYESLREKAIETHNTIYKKLSPDMKMKNGG